MNRLSIAAFSGLLVSVLTAQQQAVDWTLRQPYAAYSSGVAVHPVSGRPVVYGGQASVAGTAHLPHLWEWTGSGWLRRIDEPNPGPALAPLLVTDAQRGECLLLGASQGGMWTWNGVHWRQHSFQSIRLGFFSNTSEAAYDASRGRVVMFHGWGIRNDTWEWDGIIWKPLPTTVNPGVRVGHRMVGDDARGRTVLFGGSDGGFTDFDDTWEWDGTSWLLRTPSVSPPPRSLHAIGYDPVRQRVVVFGGFDNASNIHLSDTWEWDGTNWARVVTAHSPPPIGASSLVRSLAFDRTRNRLTLFRNVTGEVWEYDGVDWSQVVAGSVPSGRWGGTLAADPLRGNCILFGGFNHSAGMLGDTWTWDGLSWGSVTSAVSPSPRDGHVMTYDAARGEVVLFGGMRLSGTATVPLDDTWIWNGTWTQAQPTNRPPRRVWPGIAYHAPSRRIVLFGGVDGAWGAPKRNDTWTWDGIDWRQENPATSPSARGAACMAGGGPDVVLFGGSTSPTTHLADTWSWDGANWTQLQPTVSPSARWGGACAFDSARGRVVLMHGGPGGGTQTTPADTWTFDGVTWSQVATANAPGARVGQAVVYDDRNGELLVFGGTNGGFLDDTWTLAVADENGTFGAGCSGSSGVPTLSTNPESTPNLGGVVSFDVANLPLSFAVLAAGFSRTVAGSQPLPIPLAPHGMPGCDLLVSVDELVLLLGSSQKASWSLPVPTSPGVLGIEFFLQAFAWDPPTNAAGVTASNGARCRIGN